MGRKACLRSGIAYLGRSRGATRVQRYVAVGDKSRPRGMLSKILIIGSLRNYVITPANAHLGSRIDPATNFEVSKWAVPLLGYAKQTACKQAI